MDPITWLTRWFESRCDGEWESEFGVTIESVNNPGWMVKIDLDGTGLDPDAFIPIAQQRGPADWIECKVQDGVWLGGGGIGNLNEVISTFREFAEGRSPFREKSPAVERPGFKKFKGPRDR